MSTCEKKHGINNETNESKTGKGIVKCVIKNELRFELFKKCLFDCVDTDGIHSKRKRKSTKAQTTIYKKHIKLKIE